MRILLLALATSLLAQPPASMEWRATAGSASAVPFPFRAAGLYCEGDVRVRASADGTHWTEWLAVQREEDGALAYFGEIQNQLETDRDCRVLLIDAGKTADAALVPRTRQRERHLDLPPVVSREQWGCTPETCPSSDPPVYTTVTHLIVHHSAGANTSTDWPGVVRSIWVLHVKGNGWNDIGYNYLIDPNGVLYEGRAGGDGVMGAHFSGVNGGTMGVCMLGTYSTLAPQSVAVETLRLTLAFHAAKWTLDPGGRALHTASGLALNVISGHRDAGLSPRATSTTECPGNGVYTLLPELRRQVRALVEGECPLEISRPSVCTAGVGAGITIDYALPEECSYAIGARSDWIDLHLENDLVLVFPKSNAGSARTGFFTLNNQRVDVWQAAAGDPEPPCVDFQGAVNSATFDERPLAPGSVFSIFGTGFGEEATVAVNGRQALLLSAEEGRLNAVLPPATDTGSAQLAVTSNGLVAPERLIWVTESAPAIFFVEGPVRAGEIANVYLTGVGRGTPAWSPSIGTASQLAAVPAMPGVWLARVQLPATIASGEYQLSIAIAGSTSPPVVLQVIR